MFPILSSRKQGHPVGNVYVSIIILYVHRIQIPAIGGIHIHWWKGGLKWGKREEVRVENLKVLVVRM